MAMWVNLARVTPEAFERIERDPHLLGPLFLEQDDGVLATLGVAPEDISGLDYESAEEMIEASADADDDADADADADAEADADANEDADEAADADADADEDADEAAADERDDERDDGKGAAQDDDVEPGDVVLADLHVAGALAYDAGFGSAFYLTPAAAKQAAASSAALALDDEAKAIVEAAGERGHYIVGVIN